MDNSKIKLYQENSMNEVKALNKQNKELIVKNMDLQEQLSIQNVRLSCLQDVWQKWCDAKTTKEFDEWLHDEMHEA